MKIVSIIVTYNALRNEWLYKCLDSLLSSKIHTDIVVVDNASSDETCNVIKEKYPFVKLIENRENKGFGAANNQGFEYGITINADYFFLLNQDAWIESNTIAHLIEAHQKEPQFGIVSPIHLNGEGKALDYKFSNYIIPSKCQDLFSDILTSRLKKELYEVSFVNAASWLLSKGCMEKVGGFNPSFFHYGEDDNYIHRLYFHKLKLGVLPTAIIYHDREERRSNIYFDNQLITYKRGLILKVSNPIINYSFNLEYRKLYKIAFKSCLVLNLKLSKEILKKIKILNDLNRKQIEQNKIISKIANPTFVKL